jgi:predicted nucleic acid-binding protein
MILIDASVIIDWADRKDAKLRALIPSLPVAVCGVTQAEVLHGSRDGAHRKRLINDLSTFTFVSIQDNHWISIGDNLAALRSNGITVPFPDAVVATLGIEFGFEVWARDPHFPAMQKALPHLNLFQEPP